jgi:AP-1 complex subunit gamma-1
LPESHDYRACSALITKVRRAKTAAEERAIIKKESANIRSQLSQDGGRRYTKRNLIKLMYMRMLGYPAEFGQVPCLALITQGDYSGKARPACRPCCCCCARA